MLCQFCFLLLFIELDSHNSIKQNEKIVDNQFYNRVICTYHLLAHKFYTLYLRCAWIRKGGIYDNRIIIIYFYSATVYGLILKKEKFYFVFTTFQCVYEQETIASL